MSNEPIIDFSKLKVKYPKSQIEQCGNAFWYLIELTEIACKLFKWTGLPDYIPIDIVERYLFNEGRVLFFEDELTGYFMLPTAGFTKINEYGLPTEFMAIGANGSTWRRALNNSVLVKNGSLLSPCYPTIIAYCEEMANIRQAIKVNINSSKTPFVFSGDKTQLLTLKNIYKKVTDNEPVIYNETGTLNQLNVLNTQTPFIADKLDTLLISTLGKALTYLGIENVQLEKRERLTEAEATSNTTFVNYHLMQRLACRQEACEKINKMFNLNVRCEINYDYIKKELVGDLDKLIKNIIPDNENVSNGGDNNE